VKEIFELICTNMKCADLLLMRFREKLRLYKQYAELPYNQIYELKKLNESLD